MTLNEEQLQHVRNLLISRDQHLQRLYGNIKDSDAQLSSLKSRIRELEGSTSWRITRPLRSFKRLLQRK